MSGLQLPAPAASEQPGIPVYEPEPEATPARDEFVGKQPRANPLAEHQKHEQANPDDEKELLFVIDKVPFYMPKEVHPQAAFRFMRDLRKFGQMYAVAGVIEGLIGQECMDALSDTKSMSDKDWEIVGEILGEKMAAVMAGMPAGKD